MQGKLADQPLVGRRLNPLEFECRASAVEDRVVGPGDRVVIQPIAQEVLRRPESLSGLLQFFADVFGDLLVQTSAPSRKTFVMNGASSATNRWYRDFPTTLIDR